MPPDPAEAELLRIVVDALPGFVAYYDADVRLRLANAAYLRTLAGDGRRPIGRHMRDIRGEEAFSRLEERVRGVLRGEPQDAEQEVVLDGSVRHLHVGLVPHVVAGKVVGFVLRAVDATQRHAEHERLEERVREHSSALAASEERFARAFRSSPTALAIRRVRDDRMVDVNYRFVELTGYARDEVIGRTMLEIGIEAGETAAARARQLPGLRAGDGPPTDVEIPFTTRSAQARVALVSHEVLDFGAEGTCVLSTFIDITERTRGQRRLAAQDAVSRILAEATSLDEVAQAVLDVLARSEGWALGAIWLPDASGAHLSCLEVWSAGDGVAELIARTRALRFARGEGGPGRVWASGEPLLIEDVRDDPGFLRGAEAVAAGTTTAIAFPIGHGDQLIGVVDFLGAPRPLDAQLEALLAGIGRQLAVFIQRTRAVEATRSSEVRLQSVIENLNEGLVLADARGNVLHWNPAARALHELAAGADWNRALADFPAQFELSRLDGAVLSLDEWPLARILRGEVVRDAELRIRRRDIEWSRVFSYGGSLVHQPDGSDVAVVTISDITERMRRDELRRISEHLADENRRIQEASRLKDEFLANMSHELRTPLNAILGFSSLMHAGKAGPITDSQKEPLGDVVTSGKHLLQVIDDILDLAKVEAGHVEVVLEDVDVVPLVHEVRDVVRGLAPDKALPISVDVAPEAARWRADPRILKQILYNYLSNALKFTDAGEVYIRVAPDGADEVRIEVEDTGIGIAERDVGLLFTAFRQLDASPGKRYPGTGLGLALTRKLAEAHGGRAGATSVLGRGSKFFVVLPRAGADRNATVEPGGE
jgi:PAS domain S-box-containing protein